MRSVTEVLAEEYGLRGARLSPLPRGHTNESLAVDAPGGRFVLRLAWRGKALGAIYNEERLLLALRDTRVSPRIVPTRAGAPRSLLYDRVAHLFHRLPGEVAEGTPSVAQGRAALDALARLHQTLRAVPCDGGDPVSLVRARRDRVFADASARWPAEVTAALPRVRRRIDAALDEGAATLGAAQWVHGDYHPGNVLFTGDAVSGVVDFDDCGVASPAVDLAVALYTFSRDPSHEPLLRFDAARWRAAAAAYGRSPWTEPSRLAEAIFCAHQTLLHLDAARRGLWTLAPGIGFYPCFNALADG